MVYLNLVYYLDIQVGKPPGEGGGTLIFYTYVGSAHFLGSKFKISIFFGVFRKNNILLAYEDFVDIFGGHHKNGLVSQ